LIILIIIHPALQLKLSPCILPQAPGAYKLDAIEYSFF